MQLKDWQTQHQLWVSCRMMPQCLQEGGLINQGCNSWVENLLLLKDTTGLFDLSAAITFAIFHTIGSFFLDRHFEDCIHNHSNHLSSRCKKNSGCKLSGPGALPALTVLIAAITSLVKKSLCKSWSADGELNSIFSWRLTLLVNSPSGSLNLPFCTRIHQMRVWWSIQLRCSNSLFAASCSSGIDCVFSRSFSNTSQVGSQPGI